MAKFKLGIVIGFSHPVALLNASTSATLAARNARNIFQVEVPHAPPDTNEKVFVCTCRINGPVLPVTFNANAVGLISDATAVNSFPSPGLAFLPPREVFGQDGIEIWVRLLGELVVDEDNNPIAADFNRARFPSGDIRMGALTNVNPDTLLGVPGGHFDSWFFLRNG